MTNRSQIVTSSPGSNGVNMKKLFFATLCLFCLFASSVLAADQKEVTLQSCSDQKLGIKFLCNPDWDLETQNDAMLITISDNPRVLLTIMKSTQSVLLLEQLTERMLTSIVDYKDGFTKNRIPFAGGEAMAVEGSLESAPQIRVLDYYVIHDNSLYGILFSVEPKEKWDDYKGVIDTIAKSIEFVREKNE